MKALNKKYDRETFIADYGAILHTVNSEEIWQTYMTTKHKSPYETVELLPAKNVVIGMAIWNLTENSITRGYLVQK